MGFSKYLLAGTVLAVAVHASPAPQAPNFPQMTAAPTVADGPEVIGPGSQTADLVTTFASPSPSAAAVQPAARDLEKRTFWWWQMNSYNNNKNNKCYCPYWDPWCFKSKPQCPKKPDPKPYPEPPKATSTSTSTSAVVPPPTDLPKCPGGPYSPYYAALATGYTTDPALAATRTASATGACPTTPEKGTYCGFINPLDPCAPQPDGYGPVPKGDSPDTFLQDPALQASALTAPTAVPAADGKVYNQVFKNLKGSVSAQSYLGLRTLKEYDAKACAAFCDCTELCTSYNIFFERDPSLNPTNNNSNYDPGYETVWGQDCPNPPSQTNIKCTLWGSEIDASHATNFGETREQFKVVITGSNGYTKTKVSTPPQPVPNPPKPPKDCKGKGIDAPKYCIGNNFFPGPFNPKVCYLYGLALNAANKKANINQSCKFFNAYYLFKNNKPHGTYCNLYNTEIDLSFATYTGSRSGGDQYDCKQSWGYSM